MGGSTFERLPKVYDQRGYSGVVGCGKGVGYLTSQGVRLILASTWAWPAILVAGKGKGVMFLFLLFPHFHSCSACFPVPLFHLLYYLLLSLLPFSLGDDTKRPTRVDMSLNPNTISQRGYSSHISKRPSQPSTTTARAVVSFWRKNVHNAG